MAGFASGLSLPGRSKRWESAPVAEEADAAPTTATTTQKTATSSLWRSTNREIEAMPMRRNPFPGLAAAQDAPTSQALAVPIDPQSSGASGRIARPASILVLAGGRANP